MAVETIAETAKKVKIALEKSYPELGKKHFKVTRSSKYNKINVSWVDYPTYNEVSEIVSVYEGKHFDGMMDMEKSTGYTDPETGEHIKSYCYIFLEYKMTDERKAKIEEELSRMYTSWETMSDYDKRTALLRSNREYGLDGNLLDKYERKSYNRKEIREVAKKVIEKYVDNIDLHIPEDYLIKNIASIKKKGKNIDIGEYRNSVEKELLNKIMNDWQFTEENLQVMKHSEVSLKEDIEVKLCQIQTRDIEALSGIYEKWDNYLEEESKKIEKNYLYTRGIKSLDMNTHTIYWDFRDIYYSTLIDMRGSTKDISELEDKARIKIYKELDKAFELVDIMGENLSIEEIFDDIENSKSIGMGVEMGGMYKIYPVALFAYFTTKYSQYPLIVWSSESRKGEAWITVSPHYPGIKKMIKELKEAVYKNYEEKRYSEYSKEEIREDIITRLRLKILPFLEERSKVAIDNRNDIYRRLLDDWFTTNQIATVEASEIRDEFVETEELLNLLKNGIEYKEFYSKFNEIINSLRKRNKTTGELVNTKKQVLHRLLERELEAIVGNKDFEKRYMKILNKTLSSELTYKAFMKKTGIMHDHRGYQYLQYDFGENSVIFTPYACFYIQKSKKTGNYVTEVIYSLRSSTISESVEKYVNFAKKQQKKESIPDEILKIGLVMVKHMSLR